MITPNCRHLFCGTTLVVVCMALIRGEAGAQQPSGYPSYAEPPAYPQQYGYPPSQYPTPQGYGQPDYGYPPPGYSQPQQTRYVSPLKFLPTFGRKFGDMFRRFFYGDDVSTTPPMPGSNYQRDRFDSGPPPYSSHYDAPVPAPVPQPSYQQPSYVPPQYEAPPPARSNTPAMPPSSRMNSSPVPSQPRSSPPSPTATAPSNKKYTPPSVTRRDEPTPKKPSAPPESASRSSTRSTSDHPPPAPSKSSDATAGTQGTSQGTAGGSGTFLKGKRTSKPGRVISPYPPYQELDITGLASGSLALDPTTQKVFEVP